MTSGTSDASQHSAPGVVRIDSASTHGWQVRVYRNGHTHTKLFSDGVCGGREAAFHQAIAYRDHLRQHLAERGAIPRRLVRTARNGTGVVGVSRLTKRDARGLAHDVLRVTWSPKPGSSRSKSFSVRRYGEAEAIRKACQWRWERMKEIHGDRYDIDSPDELIRRAHASRPSAADETP